VRVWDIATGELLRTMEGHAEAVERGTVTPDGARIISCSRDGTVRVWGIEAGSEIAYYLGDPGDAFLACCTFQEDADVVVFVESKGSVRVVRLLGAPA
jgi:WD40 repeat protein